MESDRRYIYATFLWRLLAYIVDQLIILIPTFLIFITLGVLIGSVAPDVSAANMEGLANLIGLIISWLYYATLESSGLQASWGKALFGMKVTDIRGGRITFTRATIRYFSKILSGLVFLIGYLMTLFTPKKQALHDYIAGTLVLKRVEDQNIADFRDSDPRFFRALP
ncbi:MAG: RDD family protein [Pseudomonadota bacterium]